LTKIKIGTVGSYADSQCGPVILIMHQYAIYQQNQTIHSSVQLEHFKSVVDDRSVKAGGMQRITTNEGYIFPLDIIGGLPYLKMRPYTDIEFDSLPHVILSSDVPWNVGILDCALSDKQDWYDNTTNWSEGLLDSLFDLEGNYKKLSDPIDTNIHDLGDLNTRFIPDAEESDISDDEDSDIPYIANAHKVQGDAIKSTKRRHDYEALRPFFLGAPLETVKRTMDSTTQFRHNALAGPNMYKTFRSPFPAMNVLRRNEAVATDTIHSEVPAIDSGGIIHAQIFIGCESLVIDIYGMKNKNQFVNSLLKVIRKRGAMNKLISDSARVEISKCIINVLRYYNIDSWQIEVQQSKMVGSTCRRITPNGIQAFQSRQRHLDETSRRPLRIHSCVRRQLGDSVQRSRRHRDRATRTLRFPAERHWPYYLPPRYRLLLSRQGRHHVHGTKEVH
jgi:hypothetical protein